MVTKPRSSIDDLACAYCGGHIGIDKMGTTMPHKERRIRADLRAAQASPVEYISTTKCPGGGWLPQPLQRIPALLAGFRYPSTVRQREKIEA